MPQSRDTASSNNDGDTPTRSPGRPGQNPSQQLVIVSERGRHDAASRRIVRAQAARASAAQSRETRARNREERHRDSAQSPGDGSSARQQSHARRIQPQRQMQPPAQSHPQPDEHRAQDSAQQSSCEPAQSSRANESSAVTTLKPLANWITNILKLSAASLAAAAAALGPNDESSKNDNRAGPTPTMEDVNVSGGLFSSKQLPIALPRGFAALQSRISISGPFLLLLSRSACFDYHSPGVSNRSNQLLFDIVMTSATSAIVGESQPTHPIQEHLRIASACLAIWSGQRTEGAALSDSIYKSGLEAALQEAIVLDQNALKDAKSAEAALWAVFIISVTCGSPVASPVTIFSQLIFSLLQDLHLQHWADVRSVLIHFIYPGGSIDGACKQFYHDVLGGP